MREPRTPLRLMVWNLCHGGRGVPDGDNRELMAEAIATQSADVICCTETDGATERIVAACRRVGGSNYRGYRLAADGVDDNLAIVTRLPLRARLPYPAGRTVDSHNLGGLLLELPGGGDIAVFDTWLRFDIDIVESLEAAADEVTTGRARARSDEALAVLELPQLANIEEILTDHLPRALPDGRIPVILAGGFNTESHLDAAGLELPYRPQWQVTRRLAKAGFIDAYRTAHPDPGRQPGGTFDLLDPDQRLPHRVDYAFASGGVEVSDAWLLDRRLPAHPPGPFYSDHAALVADLFVAQRGTR